MFGFPQPSSLARILRVAEGDPQAPTWRARVQTLPPLETAPLRPAQITAIEGIEGIERSLAQQRTSGLWCRWPQGLERPIPQ